MTYFVLSETTLEKLVDEVNRYMNDGYVPTGGVHVSKDVGTLTYYQAMIKPRD